MSDNQEPIEYAQFIDAPGPPGGRRAWVGASEVSCILGVNSFKTHQQLWDEKYGTRDEENLDWKIAVQAGKFFEPGIINMFNCDKLAMRECKGSFRIHPANGTYWQHAGVDRMGASPDAFGTCSLMKGRGVFDIKYSSGFGVNRKDGKEEWHWQLQHQMACANTRFDYGAILGVFYANLNDYELDEEGRYVLDDRGRRMLQKKRYPRLIMRAFFYKRNEEMIETCEMAVADFWDSIDKGVRPSE